MPNCFYPLIEEEAPNNLAPIETLITWRLDLRIDNSTDFFRD